MVVSAEVEQAVHHRLAQVLRLVGTDHHVTQLPGSGGLRRSVDGKGQHIGGPVEPAVVAVQLAYSLLSDQSHGHVPVLDPGRRERGERGPAQRLRGVDELELDQE